MRSRFDIDHTALSDAPISLDEGPLDLLEPPAEEILHRRSFRLAPHELLRDPPFDGNDGADAGGRRERVSLDVIDEQGEFRETVGPLELLVAFVSLPIDLSQDPGKPRVVSDHFHDR